MGSQPPLEGIHEAALYVQDLDRAERFWTALGFPVVARGAGRHVFFRAGHDLLLCFDSAATSAPQSGFPQHGASGPAHVAFSVPDAGALDAWRERLHRAEVAIEAEIEWPSGGHSLYFRDPFNNSIELITRGTWGF